MRTARNREFLNYIPMAFSLPFFLSFDSNAIVGKTFLSIYTGSPSSFGNRQHDIAWQRYYKSLYGNITIVQNSSK